MLTLVHLMYKYWFLKGVNGLWLLTVMPTSVGIEANHKTFPCQTLRILTRDHSRNHRLPRGLYAGPLQPQEEQAAAHHQPQQEDHHLCWLVSPCTELDTVPSKSFLDWVKVRMLICF